MANTYNQIYIHLVFAVQNRRAMITEAWKDELYRYIVSIVQDKGHKVLAIGGMPDHVHLFVSMNPTESISHLMMEVKRSSSLWINRRMQWGLFNWQEGYGAFSYSQSQIDSVVKYILRQKEHHTKRTFIEEYKDILEKFGVTYDEKYIFHAVEDTPQ